MTTTTRVFRLLAALALTTALGSALAADTTAPLRETTPPPSADTHVPMDCVATLTPVYFGLFGGGPPSDAVCTPRASGEHAQTPET